MLSHEEDFKAMIESEGKSKAIKIYVTLKPENQDLKSS